MPRVMCDAMHHGVCDMIHDVCETYHMMRDATRDTMRDVRDVLTHADAMRDVSCDT